jgi:hypothetical protein
MPAWAQRTYKACLLLVELQHWRAFQAENAGEARQYWSFQ